jgi:hypothetical protein
MHDDQDGKASDQYYRNRKEVEHDASSSSGRVLQAGRSFEIDIVSGFHA